VHPCKDLKAVVWYWGISDMQSEVNMCLEWVKGGTWGFADGLAYVAC
jgi:hypothetical protein